jgi:ATP-dependent helicase/nuclease subunit B
MAAMDLHLHPFDALMQAAAGIVVPDGAALSVVNLALDEAVRAAGAAAWRPPAVRTLASVLAQRFEQQQMAGRGAALDFVLSPEQELALWSALIADDDVLALDTPDAAALAARDAWRALHAWRLPWPPAPALVNDDVAAFMRWSSAYLERCRELRVTDHARLLSAGGDALPPALVAHGFLAPPPAVAALLPCEPRAPAADLARFEARAYADREQELYAALAWAAAEEAHGGGRVVVALDSLRDDADLVLRCVRDVFGAREAVHVGVRASLGREPRIETALALLEFGQLTRWDKLSVLLRSPNLGGASEERAARARADAALRALNRYELPFSVVREHLRLPAHACPRLLAMLEQLLALHGARPRRQPLVRWLEYFERVLALAAWPGEAPLDGESLRVQREWGEVCDRLQRLDGVLPAHSAAEALARLRRLLNDSAVRGAPARRGVFVVTPLEAALIAPRALWLAGCESSAFVSAARPSSCLPLAMQRAAGMPGADAGRDLARARHLLAALAAGGGARIASYRAGDGELIYSPSPLLPGLRAAPVVAPSRFVPSAWRAGAAAIEQLRDEQGPPPVAAARGGTGMLAAQAACPFRAYAQYRLAARAPDEPRPGLSALDKGNVVHAALARLWSELGSQARLLALGAEALSDLVASAVAAALPVWPALTVLERRVLEVERGRLQALLLRWLEEERKRAPFTVMAVEQPREVTLAGLALRVRLDRLDRLDDGREIVIDYKTGRCSRADWQPPRMNEPQLPFYAVAGDAARVRAIAYGQVDSARPAWHMSDDEDDAEWAARCQSWAADLALLADEIAAGVARVDPKRGGQTCRYCAFDMLCRVRDSMSLVAEDDDEDGGASASGGDSDA